MIANVVTFISLCCGVASVMMAYAGHPFAPWLIAVAMACDSFDGRLARLYGGGDMGKELDSLADLVAFGVAPALLVFLHYSTGRPLQDQVILGVAALVYACSAAFRLARFNTVAAGDRFSGVPSTLAGGCAAALTQFSFSAVLLPAMWLIVLSVLMISAVPYPSFKHMSLKSWCVFVAFISVPMLVGLLTRSSQVKQVIVFSLVLGGLALGPIELIVGKNARRSRETG
jgi:CDP-diacylglycerol---serine O-phosphatidyltransferase